MLFYQPTPNWVVKTKLYLLLYSNSVLLKTIKSKKQTPKWLSTQFKIRFFSLLLTTVSVWCSDFMKCAKLTTVQGVQNRYSPFTIMRTRSYRSEERFPLYTTSYRCFEMRPTVSKLNSNSICKWLICCYCICWVILSISCSPYPHASHFVRNAQMVMSQVTLSHV